jgi:Concanavalin A-like lectin/glucanases superfamily
MMSHRLLFAVCIVVSLARVSAAAVLESLQPFLVDHYTFDNPLNADPLATVELDLGSDATNIQLLNGAPRVADGAWWGSQYSLETGQKDTGPNDDWKAGVMFSSSAESTLAGTNHVTGVTIMGWFKPLGDVTSNPSPNTETENPDDFYNAFGLAGLLRGDEDMTGLDGHTVRALLEVIDGKVTGLGRRLDDQSGSGDRASSDDWNVVMPPGVWTHLAATFDFNRGRISLYKNGQSLAASGTSTGNWQTTSGTDYTSTSNAGGIKIAGSYPDNSREKNPFNGRLDELMFFNKTLSASEVAAQFQLVSNIPGDFNLDGVVNAGDYTVWRNGLGSSYTIGDYDVWKSHFGVSALSAGSGAVAVPEPSVGMWLFLGQFLLFRHFARLGHLHV